MLRTETTVPAAARISGFGDQFNRVVVVGPCNWTDVPEPNSTPVATITITSERSLGAAFAAVSRRFRQREVCRWACRSTLPAALRPLQCLLRVVSRMQDTVKRRHRRLVKGGILALRSAAA